MSIAEARIKLTQAHVCPYCTLTIPPIELSWDHIVPRSRGGPSIGDNLVLCHRSCNMTKGPLTGIEYMALVQLMSQWPHAWEDLAKRLRAGAAVLYRRRRG